MNRPDLKNERLDRIGRKLLEASRVRSDEIEKIVAAPQLFDSVKAGIKAGQPGCKTKGANGKWANFPVWNWQRVGLAATALAFFLMGTISVIIYLGSATRHQPTAKHEVRENDVRQQNEQGQWPGKLPAAKPDVSPRTQSQITPVETPQLAQLPEELPKIDETENPPGKTRELARRTDFRNQWRSRQKSMRKPKVPKRPHWTEDDDEGEFQPLTFAGNSDEDAGQIIRVELSRSSLFALGVELPFENETDKIKTDLLVSSDGVVKGIRFAK